MPLELLRKYFLVLLALVFQATISSGQPCTGLGQTPSTAFPVCGTTVFHQASVPICATVNIFVPGCSTQPGGASYQNKNPYFYKFTCYASGTLGFLVTPLAANEDYDWQLWDITGQNPDAIFTNNSLVVTANWAGTYGPTGASATGVNSIQCGSDPAANFPTFAAMPNLIVGHEYLLMISHFTNGQSGYDLSFGGGTAVITDPNIPHLSTAKPDCDGTKITVKLNKKVKCSSLTATGSEFSLLPAVTTIISALPDSCGFGFDFDEITLTLAAPLTNGNYSLVINNGSDGNTLRDNCDNVIPAENIPFVYLKPQPIFADSVGKPGCAPDSIKIYFPKKISCGTIASNGTDFSVSGPSPVNVIGAFGNCIDGKTDYIVVKFSSPITTKGPYTVSLKAGSDGNVVIDECGQETPLQTLSFNTVDTVSADFQYNILYGCLKDTVFFSHNGAHDVNYWKWRINNYPAVLSSTSSIIASASSTNNVSLFVSNGVCSDSTSVVIALNNEVKASFEMEDIICPEDKLSLKNTSTGSIDTWRWAYGSIGTSLVKDPPPFLFPTLSREIKYPVKLVVTNRALGCSDSVTKILTVLDFCIIDIPNAFTPNNDGLNDKFGPHNALKAENYEFKVYNRWGQLVFRSTNWKDKWDGTIKGLPQQPGVFVWMLSYTHRDSKQQVFKKGTVTLIR